MVAPAPPPPPRRFRLDDVGLAGSSVALVVGAVVLAWLLRGMFVAAHRSLGWVVACAIVALLIDPAVALFSRWLPRALAIVAVLILMIAFVGLIGFGVTREVAASLDELVVEAPKAAAALEVRYDWAAEVGVAERVDNFVNDLDQRIRHRAVSQAAGTLPTYMVTGILMLFFLVGGHKYVDGFLEQLSEPRRTRWRSIIRQAGINGRGWILGSMAIGAGIGLIVGLAAWSADLPAAVSLGVITGALAITPFVGTMLGGLPLILLAFGFRGWWTGAAFVVLLVALQLVDSLLIRPALERRTVRVGVTVPILVSLIGFEIYNAGGAIYSSAVAVIALAALSAAGYRAADVAAEEAAAPSPAG